MTPAEIATLLRQRTVQARVVAAAEYPTDTEARARAELSALRVLLDTAAWELERIGARMRAA